MVFIGRNVSRGQVRGMFREFTDKAHALGFDIQGWTLSEGTGKGTGWHLVRVTQTAQGKRSSTEGLPFPSFLGGTAREAYNTLSAWVDFANALRQPR